jgi:hypothetical protein
LIGCIAIGTQVARAAKCDVTPFVTCFPISN